MLLGILGPGVYPHSTGISPGWTSWDMSVKHGAGHHKDASQASRDPGTPGCTPQPSGMSWQYCTVWWCVNNALVRASLVVLSVNF